MIVTCEYGEELEVKGTEPRFPSYESWALGRHDSAPWTPDPGLHRSKDMIVTCEYGEEPEDSYPEPEVPGRVPGDRSYAGL
jgi:hypothetical protein